MNSNGLFCLCVFVIFCGLTLTTNHSSALGLKGKRVDEMHCNELSMEACVQNKKFIWSVFTKFLIRHGDSARTAQVEKWKGPINIHVLNNEDQIANILQKAILNIQPAFPYPVKVQKEALC